jgi:hypothetical protein
MHTSAQPVPDRRRGSRIEVLGQLDGHVVAMRLPIVVRDVGSGGFSIETPVPFPIGSVQTFRFTSAQGREFTVAARSVRSSASPTAGGTLSHLTGFAFECDEASGRDEIERIVESLAGAVATH